MQPLEFSDLRHLLAAQGWMELGNATEANTELDEIALEARSHPDVLELRWEICAKQKRWQDCADIGLALIDADSNRPSGWLNHSAALRNLGDVRAAYANLYVVFDDFPETWRVPYDLARYCSLIGELEEAKEWFKKAIFIQASAVQKLAIEDPDLKPLWDGFQTPI